MKINNISYFNYLNLYLDAVDKQLLHLLGSRQQLIDFCLRQLSWWHHDWLVLALLFCCLLIAFLLWQSRNRQRDCEALKGRVDKLTLALERQSQLDEWAWVPVDSQSVEQVVSVSEPEPEPETEPLQAVVKPSAADEKLIKGYVDYIEQNYMVAGLTSEQIAAHLFVTRKQLERKVKQWLDATPNQYLIHYRLQQAAVMLRQGRRIKEAYESCGFTSHAYFSKKFKECFGCSPTEFINKESF